MEKILKIIIGLLLILSVKKVKASYVMSEWSTEYPTNIPKNVISTEKRYRWYKEEEVNIEYLIKEHLNNKLVDYNDIKYVSNESQNKPEEYEEREISTITNSDGKIIYKYTDKLYKTYELSRRYLDGYYSLANDYIKDEKTETLYYRYPEYKTVLMNADNEIVTDYEKECILGKYFCHTHYEKIIYDEVIEEEKKEETELIKEKDKTEKQEDSKEKKNKLNNSITKIDNNEIVPPKTLDSFNIYKIVFFILIIFMCWIFYYKKYVKKSRLNISSSFVE